MIGNDAKIDEISNHSAALAPFVILALPRTGSTLLTSLLSSHPDIVCHNEPFNPNAVYAAHKILDNEYMRAYRDADPIRFTDFLFSECNDTRTVGFKLLDYQAADVRENLLGRPQVKKIILRRANLLASYSSNKIANLVRQWRSPKPSAVPIEPIRFNAKNFSDYVENATGFYDHLRDVISTFESPSLKLEYTQLLDESTQQRLLEFLDVSSSVKLKTKMRRQNPGPLKERFSNWEDVVAALSGTEMEAWLDE